MTKNWLGLLLFLACTISTSSQTLFTYGDRSVSLADFMRAYRKNNPEVAGNQAREVRDYLQLYINSRLKIREAIARGYDTLPHIRSEVNNLRNQIIEGYMSDPETMERLLREARERSKKDVHINHLFIAIQGTDSSSAYKKAMDLSARLQKGENFGKLAAEFSDDPSAKTTRGDAGWITVFTLPYAFENAIYALAPGKVSSPVRSVSGYHIFKNAGERKALGKMKARHILLAFPPDTDDAGKQKIAKKADSLYKRILAGESFEKIAAAFSNDYLTAVSGGSMPDFGVGMYDPVFESKVWALRKDGAVSKPFLTSYGYHIVRRESVIPVITDPENRANEQALRQRINADQRWKMSQEVIIEKVIQQAPFKQMEYRDVELWAFTDSMIDRRPLGLGKDFNPDRTIFTFGDSSIRASDWVMYAHNFRLKKDGTGRRPYEEVMKDYIDFVAMRYYRDHLELFNDEFRYQMEEFRDGNLFFEIMQQEIWNRAHSDSAELRALFEANRDKYNWGKSADAVVFFCADETTTRTLHEALRKDPLKWKLLSEAMAENVVADSARFEWDQIPNKDKRVPVAGMVTTPVPNKVDNTISFAYIIKTYPQSMPRTFREARGLVINDYQALLEEQWLQELKKKYPVKVNEELLEKQ